MEYYVTILENYTAVGDKRTYVVLVIPVAIDIEEAFI